VARTFLFAASPCDYVAMRLAGSLFIVLLLAGRALAAEPREAREESAKKKCLEGDVAAAITLLTELFVETSDPNYLYNQARCYQMNGRPQEAIQRFREYLRKSPDASDAERARVDGWVRELQGDVSVPPPLPPPSQVVAQAEPERAPPRSSSGSLRAIALASGALGAACLGAGVYFGLKVSSLEDEAAGLAGKGLRDGRLDDRGKAAQTWQWVGYGVGAAALAAGTVTYLLSRRAEPEPNPALTFSPWLGTGGAGVGVGRAF
jgi:hypothetical protein